MKKWFINTLISVDQLVNAALLNGQPDETISARAGRAKQKGKVWGCVLCKVLNKLEKDHCEKSMQSEKEHLHEPEEFR